MLKYLSKYLGGLSEHKGTINLISLLDEFLIYPISNLEVLSRKIKKRRDKKIFSKDENHIFMELMKLKSKQIIKKLENRYSLNETSIKKVLGIDVEDIKKLNKYIECGHLEIINPEEKSTDGSKRLTKQYRMIKKYIKPLKKMVSNVEANPELAELQNKTATKYDVDNSKNQGMLEELYSHFSKKYNY